MFSFEKFWFHDSTFQEVPDEWPCSKCKCLGAASTTIHHNHHQLWRGQGQAVVAFFSQRSTGGCYPKMLYFLLHVIILSLNSSTCNTWVEVYVFAIPGHVLGTNLSSHLRLRSVCGSRGPTALADLARQQGMSDQQLMGAVGNGWPVALVSKLIKKIMHAMAWGDGMVE